MDDRDNIASQILCHIANNKTLQNLLLPIYDSIDSSVTNSLYSHQFLFCAKNSEDSRHEMSSNLLRKFPWKVPIVFEYVDRQQEPKKMLIDLDESVIRLIATIKRTNKSSDSIFILTDTNHCLMTSETVGEAYKKYIYEKTKLNGNLELRDKIMYLAVYKENIFG